MCPRNTVPAEKSAPQPGMQPVAYPPPQYPPQQFAPQQYAPPQALNPPTVQPAPGYVVVAPPTPSQIPQWTTGLLDCFDDPSSCMITLFCPCVTFGQTAEIIDKGNTSCFCAASICVVLWYLFGAFCCYTCTYRSKLRGLYGLQGGECSDCCIHCWCTYCAFCQEYRELKNRGLDPAMGWTANQQKMQQPVPIVMAPVPAMQMMR